mmetsp:Transcript_30536/g.79011  ORF Transcript_30536/g.79011 Transcript_30536/m.79011 type:complete len:116 (-) Transcript_30536:144-491(-)
MMGRYMVALLFLATLLAADAERRCFDSTFDSLPLSYSGVHRCGEAAENEKEAQNKCIGAARAKYGTAATINFTDVDHAGNARHWRDCNWLGVNCKRKCEYVYSKLSCKLNICLSF